MGRNVTVGADSTRRGRIRFDPARHRTIAMRTQRKKRGLRKSERGLGTMHAVCSDSRERGRSLILSGLSVGSGLAFTETLRWLGAIGWGRGTGRGRMGGGAATRSAAMATTCQVAHAICRIMATNSQVVATICQVVCAISQIMGTNSQVMATNSQVMATNCQVMATNSQVMFAHTQFSSTTRDVAAPHCYVQRTIVP